VENMFLADASFHRLIIIVRLFCSVVTCNTSQSPPPFPYFYTDEKDNKILRLYKEIQSGAVAKSYMRKGYLIYEEMRKYFPLYEEAVSHI
jgi:hypothetical protein